MIIYLDDHCQGLCSFIVHFLKFSEQIGGFLLIDRGVDDQKGNHGLGPISRKHFSVDYIFTTYIAKQEIYDYGLN